MNIIDLIVSRRSIRKYTDEKIKPEILTEIIRTAMYAPSAVNKRPWHFIVIDDRDKMDKIMEVHPYSRMLKTASHAVLVCGDLNLQHDTGYWLADCGAATQNLLLAAHGSGLGSCWIGIYPREKRMTDMKSIFNLPDYVNAFALVSLGYPDEKKEIPDRYEENKIHYNEW